MSPALTVAAVSQAPAAEASLSKIRLISADLPTEGEWLIDPDVWFAPEDDRPEAKRLPLKEEEPASLKPAASAPTQADEAEIAQPASQPVAPPIASQPVTPLPVAPIETPPAALPPQEPAATEPPAVDNLPMLKAEPSLLLPTEPVAPPNAERQPQVTEPTPPVVEAPVKKPVRPLEPAKPWPPTPDTEFPETIEPGSASVDPVKPSPHTDLFAPPANPLATPPSHGGALSEQSRFHASPHGAVRSEPLTPAQQQQADESHRELFAKNCYPSAAECAKCHKKQYDEWRISSHAYAMVSPMFQKFEQRINELSQGTVGYFCQRCHSPVGTTMGENRVTPLWEMPQVAREGVTCIACHRVNEQYARNNGERRIVPGPLTDPVYGGIGGDGVAKAIANKQQYKVKTSPHEPGAGQVIHNEGRFFQQLSHAEFCTSCHQVAVHPGIKLEVVWDQYRHSPACKKGVTCQDCHMGREPGVPSGYELTSIAEVGGKSVNKRRKHANHIFYGPHYSIAHPGIFPQHEKADRWTMPEWLQFDWRAGWGTEAFEQAVDEGRFQPVFPKVWQDADDRYDAREIIEDNLKAIGRKRVVREQVMEHSLKVAGPFFKHTPRRCEDLRLHYDVTNLNEGHNVLTASLGAQPQLWANVVLIGPDGRRLWETGYTDSDGDVCDIHSRDVRTGRMPFDRQLFNLQTMFLITGATGTDRELPLPVNVDIDQLAFLRPGTLPVSVTNHPPFIRMESRSISPLGTKRVKYKIPGQLLTQPGRYRLTFRMRNRIEPIYFMRFCNATDEMVRSMNEGVLDVGVRSVEFWVR